MSKALHRDHFKMGVLLNLVMLNASSMAVLTHGPDGQLNPAQARSIAGEAWGIVTSNFLVFDDDKGTLAADYVEHHDTIIQHATDALLAG